MAAAIPLIGLAAGGIGGALNFGEGEIEPRSFANAGPQYQGIDPRNSLSAANQAVTGFGQFLQDRINRGTSLPSSFLQPTQAFSGGGLPLTIGTGFSDIFGPGNPAGGPGGPGGPGVPPLDVFGPPTTPGPGVDPRGPGPDRPDEEDPNGPFMPTFNAPRDPEDFFPARQFDPGPSPPVITGIPDPPPPGQDIEDGGTARGFEFDLDDLLGESLIPEPEGFRLPRTSVTGDFGSLEGLPPEVLEALKILAGGS